MSDWRIQGVEIANCNCDWGCPCQFNALPTSGQCEAVWAMRIERGHHEGTSLDGLDWGFLVWWPGAVHEGNGRMQVFGDSRADASQRRALESIARGQGCDEGNYFQIFAAMTPEHLPSVWKPVVFECDVDRRTGRIAVDGLVDTTIEPIRNPMTGAEHRATVTLPGGFEYRTAEYASGSTSSQGPISIRTQSTHAHLARAGWNRHGLLPD